MRRYGLSPLRDESDRRALAEAREELVEILKTVGDAPDGESADIAVD